MIIQLPSGRILNMNALFHFDPGVREVTSIGGAVVILPDNDRKFLADFFRKSLQQAKAEQERAQSGLLVPNTH